MCKAGGEFLTPNSQIFCGRLFGLCKPFPAVGEYVIIGPRRPVETAYFVLIFYSFSGIILFQVLNS